MRPLLEGAHEGVIVERRDGVLCLTLDRPDRRNAVDLGMAKRIEATVDAFDDDPTLRCMVVTGAGGTFCAGSDLHAVARGESMVTPKRGGFGIMAKPPAKLVIAAVEGVAVGGGMELCMACDLLVAAESARFRLPEVGLAMVPSGGSLLRLPKRIPYNIALEMAILGRERTATELAQFGLINHLVRTGDALATAMEMGAHVAALAAGAVDAILTIVRRSFDWAQAEGWIRQREIVAPLIGSAATRSAATRSAATSRIHERSGLDER